MRERDRLGNEYPKLHYPELYVLKGGYKEFFLKCQVSACLPPCVGPVGLSGAPRALTRVCKQDGSALHKAGTGLCAHAAGTLTRVSSPGSLRAPQLPAHAPRGLQGGPEEVPHQEPDLGRGEEQAGDVQSPEEALRVTAAAWASLVPIPLVITQRHLSRGQLCDVGEMAWASILNPPPTRLGWSPGRHTGCAPSAGWPVRTVRSTMAGSDSSPTMMSKVAGALLGPVCLLGRGRKHRQPPANTKDSWEACSFAG